MVKQLLAILIALTVSVAPLYAASQKMMVNLRGDEVTVPADVPSKDSFVLQRLVSVDGRLIAFLYRDPRFGRSVDYVETYNLMGELLEISWYNPSQGLKRARDINLGNSRAKRPARILETLREPHELDW